MTTTNEQQARTFTSQIVAWCPDHQWYLPAEEIGGSCASRDCPRKLARRRMWICSVPECAMAFKKKESAKNHDCFSFY
jgi:hypothetical protein